MRRRPVCILCMLLVAFLCVTDWLGFSLIRGNPLPQSVQTWIRKHPESTICGEVVRCRENEDFQSVYLRNTYLIYNSEKVSIDNIKVYLKQKKNHSGNSDVDKLLAGSLVLVSGKLEEVQSPTNPGEFDSKAPEHGLHHFLQSYSSPHREILSFYSGSHDQNPCISRQIPHSVHDAYFFSFSSSLSRSMVFFSFSTATLVSAAVSPRSPAICCTIFSCSSTSLSAIRAASIWAL